MSDLDGLITALQIRVVAYDEAQARCAVEAIGRYGKGIHSKAKLILGDCASYALAKPSGCPLMFKGEDFKVADIPAAL